MSKNRMINTKFWSDGWIISLEPLERYLFLYLLTNEHTNICGIYELPLGIIHRETAIEEKTIIKILGKISDKIIYVDGWICIKNFLKHQRSSGNVKLGVENGMSEVPTEILAKIRQMKDTPPSVKDTPQYLNLNSNLNSNLKKDVVAKATSEQSPQGVQEMFNIFYEINPTIKFGNKTQRGAAERIIKRLGLEKALGSAKAAVAVHGQQFAPTITTPIALENKLSELVGFYKKNESNQILRI